MTTIKDIARKVGVSPSVVSRALNNKYGVKAQTRETIIKAANDLGYHPNVMARALVTRRTNTIGVLMADISEPYYAEIIKGMSLVADRENYTLIFSNTYEALEGKERLEKMVNAQRVDGLIIVGSSIKDKKFPYYLLEREIPFVLLERRMTDPRVNCLWVDNVTGAYTATKYLLDLGHKRIAHLSGNPDYQVSLDRLAGYKKALREAGISFEEELVKTGRFVWEDGYLATKDVLAQSPGCTGIFAGNDSMAYGAMQALMEMGMGIPEDMAIIGFDDLEFSLLTTPPLTTVRQPRREMGERAMATLISLLKEKNSREDLARKRERKNDCPSVLQQSQGVKVAFLPELVIRCST